MVLLLQFEADNVSPRRGMIILEMLGILLFDAAVEVEGIFNAEKVLD